MSLGDLGLEALRQYQGQSLVLQSVSCHQYSYAGWNGEVVVVFLPICYKCYLHVNTMPWNRFAGYLRMTGSFLHSCVWLL